MKNFESYVISVDCDESSLDNSFTHDSNSLKYKLRREMVINELIPSCVEISKVNIFNAIKPSDFKLENETVLFNGITYKRGIDKNYGTFCNEFQTALSLGFIELYKKSVQSQTTLLLMEDDAVIPKSNVQNINNSINDFLQIKSPGMLYLQSECPWLPGLPVRKFTEGALFEYSSYLNRINPSWYDIAGTACFMINPEGSKKMIELVDIVGVGAADQLTTVAMANQFLNVYISKDNENMALLNKELQ